jgi:hypothetical protein
MEVAIDIALNPRAQLCPLDQRARDNVSLSLFSKTNQNIKNFWTLRPLSVTANST